MARNYEKEAAWEREKYRRLHVKVDRDLADEFQQKLYAENTNMSNWFRQKIKEYLGGGKGR